MTAGVRESRAIRTVELPRLLDLARSEAFTFSIASSIESEDGKLDYEAPDRLLGQRPGTLEGMKQQPIGTARRARGRCQRSGAAADRGDPL